MSYILDAELKHDIDFEDVNEAVQADLVVDYIAENWIDPDTQTVSYKIFQEEL